MEKGRQDRDGVYEAWLMNRFEHADTPNPTTQSVAWCATPFVLLVTQ